MVRKTRRHRNKLRKQKGGRMYSVYYPNIDIKFEKRLPVSFPALAQRPLDGSTFPLDKVQDQPNITWNIVQNSGTFYSYMCFDPDSSAPMWMHMLVVNCSTPSLDSGTTLLEWAPPSPPPGTGTHRYIFALYKHSYPVNTSAVIQRGSFDLHEYLNKNGFIPVAGNSMKVVS